MVPQTAGFVHGTEPSFHDASPPSSPPSLRRDQPSLFSSLPPLVEACCLAEPRHGQCPRLADRAPPSLRPGQSPRLPPAPPGDKKNGRSPASPPRAPPGGGKKNGGLTRFSPFCTSRRHEERGSGQTHRPLLLLLIFRCPSPVTGLSGRGGARRPR